MPESAIRSSLLEDPYLAPYAEIIRRRARAAAEKAAQLSNGVERLSEFACAHEYYGLHRHDGGWVFREWAPNAAGIWLVGDFSGWRVDDSFRLSRLPGRNVWEIFLPDERLRFSIF